ncbi:unnamed protein product [Miscanthus lutarioriparius]|uniref:Uncharacterized protein n=1 Tax=Miscanthus lutarioriparius TaxID=422564 RepID=A0A811NWF9_9POAL|nr:unnamed protein product [Miscanthus lutarioriparius]
MPPGPGVADQAPPPAPPAQPPRSPHRGNGAMPMPQSPLRIKQDGKFYERLLTKESSAANLSFRYYWAEPGAVPFVWESQPGTPKDVARMGAAGALPAITPPPSYLLKQQVVASARHDQKSDGRAARSGRKRRCRLKRIRIGFIAGIFRRLSLGKRWRQRPATPVKVASSSSRWLFSSVATETGEHNDLHQDEIGAVAAHPKQHKAVPCSSPTLWLLRFRNSSGNRGGRNDGWA